MRRGGYSLIELLIVIAIIGILAGLGSYSWASASARSRDNIRKSDLARIKNSLAQYYLDNKEYPNFDTENGGRIYSAKWQLSSSTTCGHNSSIAKRLAPTFIAELPEDPRQKKDFSTISCGADLTKDQKTRYLYLSAPSEAASPTNPANGFALMAILERAGNDAATDDDNPLKPSNTSFFGNYYIGADNYNSNGLGVDANYLVTGRFGR